MRVVAAAVVLVLLVACGDDSSEPDEGTPVPATQTAEARQEPEPLQLSGIVWTTGLDPETGEPLDDVTSYPTNAPAIIAAVNVEQLPAGAELTATWTIDGTEVPDAAMSATSERAVTDAWVTFRFDRADDRLFPLGDLVVTITASDGEAVSGEVEITLP